MKNNILNVLYEKEMTEALRMENIMSNWGKLEEDSIQILDYKRSVASVKEITEKKN